MNAVPQPHPPRMTADEFIAWAIETDFRGELVAGEVVAMAPERYAHGRLKGRAFQALAGAIARAGLGCEAIVDSMAVRVELLDDHATLTDERVESVVSGIVERLGQRLQARLRG